MWNMRYTHTSATLVIGSLGMWSHNLTPNNTYEAFRSCCTVMTFHAWIYIIGFPLTLGSLCWWRTTAKMRRIGGWSSIHYTKQLGWGEGGPITTVSMVATASRWRLPTRAQQRDCTDHRGFRISRYVEWCGGGTRQTRLLWGTGHTSVIDSSG